MFLHSGEGERVNLYVNVGRCLGDLHAHRPMPNVKGQSRYLPALYVSSVCEQR